MQDSSIPEITTIIPTYRRPQLLRRAVLSALAQKGPSLQVCVYDNASDDATASVVAELAAKDPRVKYFCHPKNIGGSANFQHGLSKTTTRYFSFLSDDDVLLPGFYETAIKELEEFPDAAFWCGVTVCVTPGGRIYTARVADWPRVGLFMVPEGILQMMKSSIPSWTSVLFRSGLTDKVGPLHVHLDGPSDIEYLLRVAASNPFIVSKHAGALFLLNPESFSETSPLSCFWPGWQEMIKTVSATQGLSQQARITIEIGLRSIAQRMVFRRGAAALAKRDYEFSEEAAQILLRFFHKKYRATLLSGLTTACRKLPLFQAIYSYTYRMAEQIVVGKRVVLRRRYGHFSKHL